MQLSANVELDRTYTGGRARYAPDEPGGFESARAALVVVDMINWMFNWRGPSPMPATDYFRERTESLVVPNHLRLVQACRRSGAKVVFLRGAAAAGDYSDIVPEWRTRLREADARDGTHAAALIDELVPEPEDLVLLKAGSGGFTSSGLDHHLRHMGIEHVLYTGVITNQCVLLTAGAGFDLGYHGYLVEDATATHSTEVQAAATAFIGLNYARAVTTEAAIQALRPR
jgi:nicotinamidase-related amidase